MWNELSFLCHDRKYYCLLFYYGKVPDCESTSSDRPASVDELIRLAGNSDHPVINVLSKPGLWVQNLTTKEPDDSMIEVGIKAVEAVFDWKTWQEENLKQ